MYVSRLAFVGVFYLLFYFEYILHTLVPFFHEEKEKTETDHLYLVFTTFATYESDIISWYSMYILSQFSPNFQGHF